MAAFIVRRAAYSLLLLFFASLLVFYGLRVAPGDVVTAIASPTNAHQIRVNLNERLGLDKSRPPAHIRDMATSLVNLQAIEGAQ